jgi:ParB family chromosome partitioning protein
MTQPATSLRAFDELALARRQTRGTPIPQISLEQIAPLPGQPRQNFDPEALAELAESIKSYGVIQPIVLFSRKDVKEDDPIRYHIVCGERRYQASKLAGLPTIPALVREYTDDEVALVSLLENLQREDLTPLEEGEYLAQLKLKYGFTEEQLGERLGKSRDYVHGRTRLLKLSPDILEAWKNAENTTVFATLTPSHAILVNQLADDDIRQAMTAAIMEDGITVAEVRRRLEMLKKLDDEAAWISGDALIKLQHGAVKGMSQSEFLMRLNGYKKRLAPQPVPVPGAVSPRLALQDLAVYGLVEKLVQDGAKDVTLAELEEALKKDMTWVRKLHREGLSAG